MRYMPTLNGLIATCPKQRNLDCSRCRQRGFCTAYKASTGRTYWVCRDCEPIAVWLGWRIQYGYTPTDIAPIRNDS